MVSNSNFGLLDIEPGAINPFTRKLGEIKPGTLCWVGEEEWCACIIPSGSMNSESFEKVTRIMIGGDHTLTHYVMPVSEPIVYEDERFIWCLVSKLGIVLMGTNAHVRVINE